MYAHSGVDFRKLKPGVGYKSGYVVVVEHQPIQKTALDLLMIASVQLQCTFSLTNTELETQAPNTYQSKLVPPSIG